MGFLGGAAKSLMEHEVRFYIKAHPLKADPSWEWFKTRLEHTYPEPLAEQSARDALWEIKWDRKYDMATYVSKFRSAVARCEGTRSADEDLVSLFLQSIGGNSVSNYGLIRPPKPHGRR
eukprot:60193-Chlamydomonas_euryale.AAC.1